MWLAVWIVQSVLIFFGNVQPVAEEGTREADLIISGAGGYSFETANLQAVHKSPFRKKHRARLSDSTSQASLSPDFQRFWNLVAGRSVATRFATALQPGNKGRSPPRF